MSSVDLKSGPGPARHDVPAFGPGGFTRIAYWEQGPADGPVVICLHGLTRNARDFDVLGAALARSGYHVFAVDMPGRGASAWLTQGRFYGYPLYLAATAAVIQRSGAERVKIVGTSMGGLIGMLLAAQLNAPIAGLVLNDVGPFIPKIAIQRIGAYLGLDPLFADLAQVEAALRKVHAPFGRLTDAQWHHLALHSARKVDGGYRLNYDTKIARPFKSKPAADVDLWTFWDRVSCPTLIIRGAQSDLLMPETVREMKERARAPARAVEIAGCGHAPALMADDQIEIVRKFLATC